MEGQLSIFDWMPAACNTEENTNHYWDEDINCISIWINRWIEKVGAEKRKEQFSIWEHVPNLGYRLEIWTYLIKNATAKDWKDLDDFCIETKKNRKIEVSTSLTPTGMMISTIFLDGRINKK